MGSIWTTLSLLTEEQETKRRQQMAGYPHRTILGVANRWEERKGLDTFIRLAEELPANYTVEILGLDKHRRYS